MTGPEHYREAEQALELAIEVVDDRQAAALLIAGAQAHATLAMAAATAMAAHTKHQAMDPLDFNAWNAVCGVKTPVGEPETRPWLIDDGTRKFVNGKPIGYCAHCVERCEGHHPPCFDEVIGCTEVPQTAFGDQS